MSVNNNTNIIPAESLLFEHGGLENAGLTQNEKAILSNCDYGNFKTKWGKGLGNISPQAHKHIRNTKEVKEGIFRQLGAAMGFCSFEPWKETQQVFSDWKSFDSYVRMKISSETYQKIAKANPQYFDKVIEHLEQVADDLDKRADVRLGTFVSHQSGETLAMLANDFRSTAAFLRLKMNGDDAAKPGNNNAKPVANPGDRPTVINHYHNHIGHIGDINIGHLGDNNFYNKNGNMGVMFQGNPSDIRHTGFKSEYSVSKSQHSYYSPIINGRKLLELKPEDAVKLLGQGDENKGKKLEVQHNDNLMFKAEPLPKEWDQKNFKNENVNSINIEPKKDENAAVSDEKKDLSNVGIQTENNEIPVRRPISENSFITKERITKSSNQRDNKVQTDNKDVERKNAEGTDKTTGINSVQSEKNPAEKILTDLQNLRDKYYRLWDEIHRDKNPKSANTNTNNSIKNRAVVFENNNRIKDSDDSFTKLTKLFRQIVKLTETLKTLEQSQKIDRHQLSSISTMLHQITQVIGNDKKTAVAKEIPQETGKSDLADKQHGLSWKTEVQNRILSEEEKNMTPDAVRNILVKETQKVIGNINKQLETFKKK